MPQEALAIAGAGACRFLWDYMLASACYWRLNASEVGQVRRGKVFCGTVFLQGADKAYCKPSLLL